MFSLLALLVTAEVTFTKTVIDPRFISEGIASADVNRDGKLDILAGNVWYESPTWKAHEIALVPTIDPKKGYSNCFHNWAADLNGDGWVDQILIGMPGEKAIWRENPKGSGPWKEHLICASAGNESPLYHDLFGNGKRVLVMGTEDKFVAWFEPDKEATKPWIMHPISGPKGAGSQRYSHGLGIGDLDGDGRNEVLTTAGFYTIKSGNWEFVPANLGPDCAHMIVFERSIFTTSAHARGVWKFSSGNFERTEIDNKVGQTHSAILANFGPGATPNLITGKRKWAHQPGVDVGSEEPAWLVRYELGKDRVWRRHVIDEDSGVGTQIESADMNGDGLLDILTANKNGVFLFTQK